MRSKVSALTGSQIQALELARDSHGLDVTLTKTTATFPDSPGHAANEVERAKNELRNAGASVSVARPLAFVARKLRATESDAPAVENGAANAAAHRRAAGLNRLSGNLARATFGK